MSDNHGQDRREKRGRRELLGGENVRQTDNASNVTRARERNTKYREVFSSSCCFASFYGTFLYYLQLAPKRSTRAHVHVLRIHVNDLLFLSIDLFSRLKIEFLFFVDH